LERHQLRDFAQDLALNLKNGFVPKALLFVFNSIPVARASARFGFEPKKWLRSKGICVCFQQHGGFEPHF
jgi:hypothetical protein